MIIPNLMVTNMPRSLAFYRDVLGMKPMMAVSPQRDVISLDDTDGAETEAVFVILEWENDGGQLMLQTATSLADELPVFAASQQPSPAGTVYFRGLHPSAIQDRVPESSIVKGPFLQWYGMLELYIRDPDGHIICVGVPEGDSPA